ncbi:MAG: hypothetical protein ABL927_13550, partial [Bdellovibrionales bacterium]
MNQKHRQKVTYALIAAMMVPFLFWVKLPTSWSATSLTLYLALITGFIGTVFLMWQFILGTRTITGLIYKDQNWALKIHKWLGKWGTLAIFAHPILITYAYGESLLYSFIPGFKDSFETAVSWGR